MSSSQAVAARPVLRPKETFLRFAAATIGPRTDRRADLTTIRRILILQLQQLGDSAVFTPTLSAIRRQFPHARIDILCSQTSYQFYRKCASIHRLWRAAWVKRPAANSLEAVRQVFQLRRQHYDLAIADVTQVSAIYPLIAFLSGARSRIGFDVDGRGFLFTWKLRRPDGQDFLRCNLTLANALGAASPSASIECYFDAEDLCYADSMIARVHNRRRLIAVHPASNWQSKIWFPERWAAVIDVIATEHDATIVFVGSENEREYIENITGRLSIPVVSAVGQTSLSQLAAFLTRCDLFVGTDSGPRHVAAGARCPRVILMSAQDREERWQFGDPSEIVLRTNPSCSPCLQSYCSHRTCMQEISNEAVIAAVGNLLEGESSRRFPPSVTAASATRVAG